MRTVAAAGDVDSAVAVAVAVAVAAASGSLALSAGFLLQRGEGRGGREEAAGVEVRAAVDASAARVWEVTEGGDALDALAAVGPVPAGAGGHPAIVGRGEEACAVDRPAGRAARLGGGPATLLEVARGGERADHPGSLVVAEEELGGRLHRRRVRLERRGRHRRARPVVHWPRADDVVRGCDRPVEQTRGGAAIERRLRGKTDARTLRFGSRARRTSVDRSRAARGARSARRRDLARRLGNG